MPPLAHSLFGASSAHRYISCPASIKMINKAREMGLTKEQQGDLPSYNACRGTLLHEISESILSGQMEMDQLPLLLGESFEKDGRTISVGRDEVNIITRYVSAIHILAPEGATIQVEQRVDLSFLHPGCFGTADCVAVSPDGKEALIADLKTGMNPVSPVANPQLMYYALGALGEEKLREVETLKLAIIQPAVPSIGVALWETTGFDVIWWAYNVLKPSILLALSDNPPIHASEKACRWCDGAAVCPEIRKVNDEIMKDYFPEPVQETPSLLPCVTTLSDSAISRIINAVPLLKEYIALVQAEARTRMTGDNGREIAGLKVVKGRRQRKWKDDGKIVGSNFPDLAFERKLRSPSALEKIFSENGLDKAILAPYIETTTTEERIEGTNS